MTKQTLVVAALTLCAIGLLIAVFQAPIWWVSLTAPNYPAEAFPDGVRIHFHFNGVFNGCEKVEKREIREEEALDCVHEMDTINHYVGMYPIAAGGVIERAFAPFLVSMLGVMLVGFACTRPRLRMALLGLGFAGIAGWMYLTYYGADGLRLQNEGYIRAAATALDQSAGEAESAADLSPGQALIARLRQSMEDSESRGQAENAPGEAGKQRLIDGMRVTFAKDQQRLPAGERQEWTGSGAQVLAWHYGKTLGRYFNNPAEITPMVASMRLAGQLVFWGMIAAMALLVFGARRNGGLLYWLLVLVPLLLPVFFIIDYSAWLWWYGHSLNAMGAFTVKPFMPTVFGDGKVAQFTTHSYPYYGFGLMLALSVLLAVAALVRRKEWKQH